MWFKCDLALFSNMISLISESYCSMILGVLQVVSLLSAKNLASMRGKGKLNVLGDP